MKAKIRILPLLLVMLLFITQLPAGVYAASSTKIFKSNAISSDYYYWGGKTIKYTFQYADGTSVTANLGGFAIHYAGENVTSIVGSQVAYCIEPNTGSTSGTTYSGTEAENSAYWKNKLTANQRRAIQLIMLYGAPNGMNSTDVNTLFGYEGATQILIWEIVMGLRSPLPPYTLNDSRLKNNFYGNSYFPSTKTAYNSIINKMNAHLDIPSFSSNLLSQAKTWTLSYDAASGLYKGSLTDTNGVLSKDYTFSAPGVTFSKNGNTLNISAPPSAFSGTPVTASATGNSLSLSSLSQMIWTLSGKQTVTTFQASPDPVPCYFKLDVDGGTASIKKTAASGDVDGYCLKRIASITTFSDIVQENGQTVNRISLLYGFPVNNTSSKFFDAIGLSIHQRVEAADNTVDGVQYYYFTADALIAALEYSMEYNATETRTALENYVLNNGGTTMPETDSFGHTYAEGLELGLYLVVETKVPEMITCTTTPFLASVPMTTVNGGNADNGGEEWNYDITIYPKNTSGNPDLEKTVRESKPDTGDNNGSATDINDGFEHTATGSAGDVMEYQILSSLPTITSKATQLSTYTFVDTLSKGITYNRDDVVLEFFRDTACTDKVATWRQTDSVEMFQVSYADGENSSEIMTISMTEAGLKEINTSKLVYPADTMVNSGFSGCTLRITYAATVNSDADLVLGDEGNPNEVTLTWKRSNSSYYDTLKDCCHVYSYGIDLLKQFSDGAGKLENVEFVVKNATDSYFVQAQYDDEAKVYYVTGHIEAEADATHFIPSADGHIFIRGLEDDTYVLTEVKTDNGYSLLKNDIEIVISVEDGEICEICGEALKVASATVNGKPVTMDADGTSVHAVVPLSVTNMKGFDLPKTGDRGTWMYGVLGAALIAASGLALFLALKKRKSEQ